VYVTGGRGWRQFSRTMQGDVGSGEERTSADGDQALLDTINASGSGQLWRRLLKDAGLGVIALLCLLSYVYYPQPWVVVVGVVAVVSVAWLSEMTSRDGQLPAHSRSVLVTGCDTGNVATPDLHIT